MKNRISCFFVLIISFLSFISNGQIYDFIVGADGKSGFSTIQGAINAVPDNSVTRIKIFVKNGTYKEKINLSATKTMVSLIGENRDSVVISWYDYSGKGSITTATSYTFLAGANDFYAENLTINNTAGKVGQAVALRTTGDRMVFNNCQISGFQDTYYANKNRQYNYKCTIEGGTDFIFGDATAVFDSCIIQCVNGGSFITAPADTKIISSIPTGNFLHGLLFTNCQVVPLVNVQQNSYFLGRPWHPNSSSVFINCELGNHIKSEGWSEWSGNTNHLSSVFAEYKNYLTNGNFLDISKRVSWSKQISDNMFHNYYNLSFFLKKNNEAWNPVLLIKSLPYPEKITFTDGAVTWSNVSGSIGYVVFKNDRFLGFASSNIFTDPLGTTLDIYKVKSVNEWGGTSRINSIKTRLKNNEASKLLLQTKEKTILFNEPVDFKIINYMGEVVASGFDSNLAHLEFLESGNYIVIYKNHSGETLRTKIYLN